MTLFDRVKAAIQDLEREGLSISVRTVRPRVHANNAEVAEALKRLRPALQSLADPSTTAKERPMTSNHAGEYRDLHQAVIALRPILSQLAKDHQMATALDTWFTEQQAAEPKDSRTMGPVADYVQHEMMTDKQERCQARMAEASEALPALLAAVEAALPPLVAEVRRRRKAWHQAQRQEREALRALNAVPGMLLQEAQQLLHQAEKLSEAAAVG
jgi:hypothetical protein